MTGGEKYFLGVGSTVAMVLLLTGIIGTVLHTGEGYKQSGWPLALVFGGMGTLVLMLTLGCNRSNCKCNG